MCFLALLPGEGVVGGCGAIGIAMHLFFGDCNWEVQMQ